MRYGWCSCATSKSATRITHNAESMWRLPKLTQSSKASFQEIVNLKCLYYVALPEHFKSDVKIIYIWEGDEKLFSLIFKKSTELKL